MNAVPTILEPSKPYDREQGSSKRHKGRTLVQIQIGEKEFTIDQDDYNAIKAIQSPMSWKGGEGRIDQDWIFSIHVGWNGGIHSQSATASDLALNSVLCWGPDTNRLNFEFDLDDKNRVSYLNIGDKWHSDNSELDGDFAGNLPDEVWGLSALKKLSVSNSTMESISSDIAQLKNLEDLELCYYSDNRFMDIPDHIGNLNLKRLSICDANLYSLPSSIGNLTSLEELVINCCPMEELPEEFGDLSALRRFFLNGVSVSITSSIRRLQNLEELNLVFSDSEGWGRFVDNNAIEHIGQLVNLKELILGCEEVYYNDPVTFPPCMKNLHQLEGLCLVGGYYHLFHLPKLELMRKLSNLKFFYYEQNQDVEESILDIVQVSPRLGEVSNILEKGRPELTYALACNRFKCRTSFGCGSEEFSPLIYKLWPRILGNPTHAFRRYRAGEWGVPRSKIKRRPTIKPHDALYKLLLDGRESFIQALLRCNSGST